MKKKLQPISYGVTKTEFNYQIMTMDLLRKLIEQTKQTNGLLKGLLYGDMPHNNSSDIVSHASSTAQNFFKKHSLAPSRPNTEAGNRKMQYLEGNNPLAMMDHIKRQSEEPIKRQQAAQDNSQEASREGSLNISSNISSNNEGSSQGIMKNLTQIFQVQMKQITATNKELVQRLLSQPQKSNKSSNSTMVANEQNKLQSLLSSLIDKNDSKKKYSNYGIISEIMPFSDKREVKVRFNINELVENGQQVKDLPVENIKVIVTEWVGMVFRATASICWNMLFNQTLSFQEVKVLFTENVIYNFIELMIELEKHTSEETRLGITIHINQVSKDVLEFLCRQYPQTKIQAPNMALKKAIPQIQNQGQIKYDTISKVLKESYHHDNQIEHISFEFRQDKDYSSMIMKTINYMIEKTDQQFDQFQKIMGNLFENILLPKDKRQINHLLDIQDDSVLTQYKAKAKIYSSYAIGRKIPKNTPKYTDLEIQYGVFFVKGPSILRIITKWVQQLYEMILKANDKQKTVATQLKNHEGNPINVSSRLKHLLFQQIHARLPQIQEKIDRIKGECYNLQYQLTQKKYIEDVKQSHLGDDQLCVGKFSSSLKNAISSYVCSELSKIIYYLAMVPKQTDEHELNISEEDFLQQARKHLDSTSLVSMKLFDLLRCKCHSNEEEIIWIVEALKQLEKDDKKFEIVRVKDRLNQGTRDIMINAQYDGGLVWEIQLAVTSSVDKKQKLLDNYNHFLYQLKRAKLGPISQCVSIWSSLEQRSIYFQQLSLKKKQRPQKMEIFHSKPTCKSNDLSIFSQFKRPIICLSCKEYFSIPTTSLLNIQCELCRVKYCGLCFYQSLSDMDQKRFIFRNLEKKHLFTKRAFEQLVQYSDQTQPFPKEGFFIKKKFLNRQISYFTVVKVGENQESADEKIINISQTILKEGQKVSSRCIHKSQIIAKQVDGQYKLVHKYKELNNFWFFYFPNRQSTTISVNELQVQLKSQQHIQMKYLNVLKEPNFIRQSCMVKKNFQKVKLINSIKQLKNLKDFSIAVYRFKQFTILAKYQYKDESQLQEELINKSNKKLIKSYAVKKVTVLHLDSRQISKQFHQLTQNTQSDFVDYLGRVQKLYLAYNMITDLTFLPHFTNLELLYIANNKVKSFKGVQKLTTLNYIKFDSNQVSSLEQLSNLVHLQYISGNYNQINSLKGLSKLIHLGSISFCANLIEDVSDIKDLPSLSRIYLRDNPLKDIEKLSGLRLKHLFIGQTPMNPLSISSFSCMDVLLEISLKGNNMSVIPKIFDKMTVLESLKLSDNKIKDIDNIISLVELKSLDLRNNEIQVMNNLQTLINLEDLKLGGNKITIISGVRTFLDALKTLNLELNPLDDVSQYLMYQERTNKQMRLRYSANHITEKAANQLKMHSLQINNRSDGDD